MKNAKSIESETCPFSGKKGYVKEENCHCFCCGKHSPTLKGKVIEFYYNPNVPCTCNAIFADTHKGYCKRRNKKSAEKWLKEKSINSAPKGCGKKQGVYNCGDIIGKNKDCIILCVKCSEDNNENN